jgi:hypothetical protein
MEYRYDVFISYHHQDREFAQKLVDALDAAGVHIAIDYKDFTIGEPVALNMERLIESSRYVVVILSPDWLSSEWSTFEALLIQLHDPMGVHGKLLPVLYRPCDMPNRLRVLNRGIFKKCGNRR